VNGNILSGYIAIQDGLVQRIAELDFNVVHLFRKCRVADQRKNEIIQVLLRFEFERVIPGAMRSWDPLALLDARGWMWLKERPGIWRPAQPGKFAARRGADRRT